MVAVAIVAGAWATAHYAVQWDRSHRLTQSAARATELVGFFESDTLKIIGYSDIYLKAARRVYQDTGSIEAVADFMVQVPRDTNILSHITIIDPSGVPVFISGHEVRAGTTAADRPYFQFQRRTPGDEIYLSQPHRGRNTGRLTMRLVRRIETADGGFGGVIFAAIDIAHFTQFFSALELGGKSSATLVGLDRKIRARSSYGRYLPGQDISGSVLWQELETAREGLYNQTSGVDGINRYYAYKQLASYPLLVVIGIANDDILKGALYFALSAYTIATLVTLVIVLLTSSVLRDGAMLRKLRQEILDRRRAEAEALRATEVKSAFLATMSHEVRTPINAIMGLFELIEQAEVPDRQKTQARAGRSAAGELLTQLSNVLDASRLEANSMTLTPRPEPIAPILQDWRQLLEAAIARSGKPIEARSDLAEGVPEIAVLDRRRVDQVFINLIDNAVKFTASGTIAVTIDTVPGAETDDLRIMVSDTGIGIPQHDQDRIFGRFVQLDRAITRTAGGAGLGLSICRELAALMRGKIEVASKPGQGAAFALMLPIQTPAPSPVQRNDHAAA